MTDQDPAKDTTPERKGIEGKVAEAKGPSRDDKNTDGKALIDTWVPRLALVMSVVALVVSMKGCQTARDAYLLGIQQYREERQLVLTGEFTSDGDAVKLRSVNDTNTFMEGSATFPTLIEKGEWPIRASDKTLHLTMAKFGLQQLIEKKVPREKGYIKASVDGYIPVLIEAHYSSKGEAYLDQSLYMLGVEFTLDDNADKPPAVRFNGVVFAKRFRPDEWVSRQYLDQLMEDKNGFYIPPKSP